MPDELNIPVVFFIFRRPEKTQEVFNAIRLARPKVLFIIADGPNAENNKDLDLSVRTREVVKEIDWPCDVRRLYSETNLGLRQRIMTGLDAVFAEVDSAIILEDDCLPNSSFFTYCSELLEEYKDNEAVGVISGFNFSPFRDREADYYFSRSPSIWGWATWSNTWKKFRQSPQVESWSKSDFQSLKSTFPSRFQRSEFFWLMQIADTLNTWDVSFFVWFRQSRLLATIPRANLVRNIGFGSEATHTKFESFDLEVPLGRLDSPYKAPSKVEPNHRLERSLWMQRRLRWIIFPISHPIKFMGIVGRFLAR